MAQQCRGPVKPYSVTASQNLTTVSHSRQMRVLAGTQMASPKWSADVAKRRGTSTGFQPVGDLHPPAIL